jgi:hypothetical protein
MNREIKLSGIAARKLDNLLIFLEHEWSATVKDDFVKKLNMIGHNYTRRIHYCKSLLIIPAQLSLVHTGSVGARFC